MRLQVSRSAHAASLYIVKSTYDAKTGKRSNKVVKKLGTMEELAQVHEDPIRWGKELAKKMTEEEKLENKRVLVSYNPSAKIRDECNVLFNGGYLFLQKVYYSLGLDRICKRISSRYQFQYDLNEILKTLIYGRVLFPASKKATFEMAQSLLETPQFEQHDIYRALEVLAKENDFIQSELYRESKTVIKRNDNILFYDCTNFFFELEQECGLKQYGVSKENRPNPIIQMGLFMDADGIPLTFSLYPGNTNEQVTLKPLENKILQDFGKSKFIVCTDAGLASWANRQFNNIQGRAFITTQSLKKMKDFQKEWALDPEGWRLSGESELFNLDLIRSDEKARERYKNAIFYKERWFNERGLEQRYIVSFSLKYMEYAQSLRIRQVTRAVKLMDSGHYGRKKQNDPARFVDQLYVNEDGEICDNSILSLNQKRIDDESAYDGFYCSATNLEDDADVILRINRKRWEIEESFRILKSEFKARPVYLSRDDRINAHFLICFLSLYIFRILEKKLKEEFTCEELTNTLRQMLFLEIPAEGYVPAYTRNNITDALHESFDFYTDYEITKTKKMKNIIKESKKS